MSLSPETSAPSSVDPKLSKFLLLIRCRNSVPRIYRSAAIPNPNGTHAFYRQWTDPLAVSYYLLDLTTGDSTVLPERCLGMPPNSSLTNFIWMGCSTFGLCRLHVDGRTELYSFNAKSIKNANLGVL